MIDLPTMQAMKDAFSLFREGIAAARDAKSLLPGPQQEAVSATLERASTQAALAEAQIAQALGFMLHRCTFPPQIMLAIQTDHGQEQRCPGCGYTTKHNEPPPEREDEWISARR